MSKSFILHCWVTKSNFKNIKLHFELLTQSRLILEIQLSLCLVPLEGHQEKTSSFFWTLNKDIFHITISCCLHWKTWDSKFSFFYSCVKHMAVKHAHGNSSKFVSQVKKYLPNQCQTWKCQGSNNNK